MYRGVTFDMWRTKQGIISHMYYNFSLEASIYRFCILYSVLITLEHLFKPILQCEISYTLKSTTSKTPNL